MMTIEEMKAIKKELGITYQQLCKASGIPISTLQKILGGVTENPRASTLFVIEDTLYTMKLNHDKAAGTYHPKRYGTTVVRDGYNSFAPFSYGSTAEQLPDDSTDERLSSYRQRVTASHKEEHHVYTVTERESFPTDMRTEIIDGVLYDMASPTMFHQDIARYICRQLEDCIIKHGMPCHAFIAPADVQIDCDEYTVVQPDVFIVCDESQITRKNIQGAPAFILEVFSPSTKSKDQFEKLGKYLKAGVQEYWTIDPSKKEVVVYDMRQENKVKDPNPIFEELERCYDTAVYHFGDRIPVLISEGRCEIDMAPLEQELDRLYGKDL